MGTRQRGDLPARLEGVRQRFERWRQTLRPAHSRFAVGEGCEDGRYVWASSDGEDVAARLLHAQEACDRNEVAHAEPSEKGAAAPFIELYPLPPFGLANASWSWRTPAGRRCGFS